MARWTRGESDVEAARGRGAGEAEGRRCQRRAAPGEGDDHADDGSLRRQRNELEYPERPGDDATHEEAAEAVDNAQAIITAAEELLD